MIYAHIPIFAYTYVLGQKTSFFNKHLQKKSKVYSEQKYFSIKFFLLEYDKNGQVSLPDYVYLLFSKMHFLVHG